MPHRPPKRSSWSIAGASRSVCSLRPLSRAASNRAGLEMENLTASCRRCAPDIGFLLVSSHHSHAESLASQARTEILSSPFSSSDLLDAVRALSGAPLAEECEEACA